MPLCAVVTEKSVWQGHFAVFLQGCSNHLRLSDSISLKIKKGFLDRLAPFHHKKGFACIADIIELYYSLEQTCFLSCLRQLLDHSFVAYQ